MPPTTDMFIRRTQPLVLEAFTGTRPYSLLCATEGAFRIAHGALFALAIGRRFAVRVAGVRKLLRRV